jgi:polysaccharide biosynthesis protein PslF
MVTYGFLSTFPPTRCGLATFSLALAQHLHDPAAGERCGVVHVVDRLRPKARRDHTVQLVNGHPLSAVRAIEALNRCDVTIVQHDFDIYGGPDGDEVLAVLEAVEKPKIIVLHTVPAAPAPHRRLVLQHVIDAASAIVVLSHADASTLVGEYRVAPDRISVIPRGAAAVTPARPDRRPAGPQPPTILTWGLIGPGKGIEWALAALGLMRDMDPMPRYLICGQTHPRVAARDGDAYRESLYRLVREGSVTGLVQFDSTYRAPMALAALIHRADVVLLPYDSRDRTTSAVLTEAVAARRPVVATAFPYARELLGDGAGLVVPYQDPVALSRALRRVLTEPGLANTMQNRSGLLAPRLAWPGIAASYRGLAQAVLGRAAPTSDVNV